jgi:hypothetical protein
MAGDHKPALQARAYRKSPAVNPRDQSPGPINRLRATSVSAGYSDKACPSGKPRITNKGFCVLDRAQFSLGQVLFDLLPIFLQRYTVLAT